MREILVPVDFSGPSQRACDLALELAATLGAGIVLMRAVEPLPVYFADRATTDGMMKLEAEQLTRRAAALRPYASSLQTLLVAGSPKEEIPRVAAEREADLVVMGTHGRRGLARAVLGSVAEHVVRTSRCPVLTVPGWSFASRADAAERLARQLRPLAMPSPLCVALSRGAVPIATALARSLGGSSDVWLVSPIAMDGKVVGAVTEQGDAVFDTAAPDRVIEADRRVAVEAARRALSEELMVMRGGRSICDVWHRELVLVEEGATSPASLLAAARSLRAFDPARIVAALPIAHREALAVLRDAVDALVCLEPMVARDDPSHWFRDDDAPSPAQARDAIDREALGSPPPR